MNDQSKPQRQLQQLLAQDLVGMGYEARIRHKQRIEALQAECAPASASGHRDADSVEPFQRASSQDVEPAPPR